MKNITSQGEVAQRLLRRKHVEQALGISRSTIYSRLDYKSPGYDPEFPRPIKMGAKTIAFVESEIQEYIVKKIALSRGGAK